MSRAHQVSPLCPEKGFGMMSEHVPTGTIVRRFLYLNVTCVGEPLVKSVEKPVALVREEETMPEKTHDDPSNSTSFSPLTIWWKSKTRYARSGTKKDGCLPFSSRASNSSKKDGICTTTPVRLIATTKILLVCEYVWVPPRGPPIVPGCLRTYKVRQYIIHLLFSRTCLCE